MAVKINWINENPGAAPGDGGFWRSVEGRFDIEPLCMGRTTPQAYKLTDRASNWNDGFGRTVTAHSQHYTVREAKAHALSKVTREINKGR